MRIQLSKRGIALQGLCLDFFGVISCSIEAQLFKATNQQVSRITPMNTKGPQTNTQNLKGKQKTQAFKRKTSKFLTQTWNNFSQCNVYYSTWKRYLMKALIQTNKEKMTVGAERFSRLRIKINIHEMAVTLSFLDLPLPRMILRNFYRKNEAVFAFISMIFAQPETSKEG